MTITDTDIRTQVQHALAEHTTEHDVDAIVSQITSEYGLVDIETIDHDEFWAIVERHPKEHAMIRSQESASTPISAGGWRYSPDDTQDVQDFAGSTAAELAQYAAERGYDFSRHPAIDPGTDYGTLTDYVTGAPIRPATGAEHARSLAAGESGAFELDGQSVFVAGGPES